MILNSLTYTNLYNIEPHPLQRYINISISDGTHPPVTAQLTINIVIFNNHPPVLSFGGKTSVIYNETVGSNFSLVVGSILRPLITDADNNDVFKLQGGVVRLLGALDGNNEALSLSESLPAAISATGKMSIIPVIRL